MSVMGLYKTADGGRPVTFLTEPYGVIPEEASPAEIAQYRANFDSAREIAMDPVLLDPQEALTRSEVFRSLCSNFDPRPLTDIQRDWKFIIDSQMRE